MEQLTTSVYECTLAVEAHMVCDLLSQAGISARVDGAFLSGVGGELPLGNTVKVRVAPDRAAEGREVIADWEKMQPAEPLRQVPHNTRISASLYFLAGALCGAVLMFIVLGYRNA